MEFSVAHYIAPLSKLWGVDEAVLQGYLDELNADGKFLSDINDLISDVADFSGIQFTDVGQMRCYRCLLYLAARVARPEVCVETGVQNGMSSAFVLLALHHNGKGKLISVDLPPVEQRILDQGTRPLPKDKSPGWLIPDYLRGRHQLHLGAAEELLPRVFAEEGRVDLFVHDSDHCYSHIMFEIGLAWRYLSVGGHLLVDNVEQNAAFDDFARGVQAPSTVVSTFNGDDRVWQHGVLRKIEAGE